MRPLDDDNIIQPTSPQPEPTELEKALEILEKKESDALVVGEEQALKADSDENEDALQKEDSSSQEVNRDELIASIKMLLEQREKVCARNTLLQNKLGDYFKRKRNDDVRDGEKSALDQELRYDQCMASLNDLRIEFNSINTVNKNLVAESKAKVISFSLNF